MEVFCGHSSSLLEWLHDTTGVRACLREEAWSLLHSL